MNTDTYLRVKKFTLFGLHGYKDVSIDFSGNATVLVAENGTGKTTVLSALNAFLTKRFHRLAALPFTSLACEFEGQLHEVTLNRDELNSIDAEISEDFQNLAKIASISEDELHDFVQNVYSPDIFEELKSHRIVSQIYYRDPNDWTGTKQKLDHYHSIFKRGFSQRILSIQKYITSIMEGIDVIYLPTFRRIERPMLRASRKSAHDRHPKYRHTEDISSYSYEGIAFGLGDIQARLAELSEEIERTANIGYRRLSTKILQDMLTGRSITDITDNEPLPDFKSLSLFLGRVGRVENNVARLFSNIENLYNSHQIHDARYDYLRYFLVQLNSVIIQTKYLEQKIEQFVTVCNGYLRMSGDEKMLDFNPETLKVFVKYSWTERTSNLDVLSSGEKQIVSLMAKLYLYEGNKFIMIDEPELSLSIEWQRKILPDMLKSGTVTQLLAVTHSPFIFENDLDYCATGMNIRRSPEAGNAFFG